MFLAVHPAETMLRGDGKGYNPRDIRVTQLAGGYELLTGVFRDDGVRSGPKRPERPFHIIIPKEFEAWHALNSMVFVALESGGAIVAIEYL
jgi:hypothetical protein